MAKCQLRPWQKNAKNIVEKAIDSDKNTLVAVNACVGSGKTTTAWVAMEYFIKQHSKDKTFQMFVCPRIKLCKQQAEDVKNYFTNINRLNYHNKVMNNVSVIIWNSASDDIANRNVDKNLDFFDNVNVSAQHIICIICDESLWGIEKHKDNYGEIEVICRFDKIVKVLKNNEKFGRINGVIAYDEAHNYQKKQKEMFGEIKNYEYEA